MIGRQRLIIGAGGLKRNLAEFGFLPDEDTIRRIFRDNDGYAEGFLRYLGANEVHSFDNSGYEGATHLHDLNQEIPDCYKERYSMVLDGGSLEHVFNFPVALRNCMEMVEVGGHYLAITPVNNLMGHGFYQFSPELYSSVFSQANGYQVVSMIAYEEMPLARWFSVVNPHQAGARVTLTNRIPTNLLVIAKRMERTVVFESVPQQIHYFRKWDERGEDICLSQSSNPPRAIYARLIPPSVKRFIRRRLEQLLGYNELGFDPRFFQPMKPSDDEEARGKAPFCSDTSKSGP
jgi:hypothetical protein